MMANNISNIIANMIANRTADMTVDMTADMTADMTVDMTVDMTADVDMDSTFEIDVDGGSIFEVQQDDDMDYVIQYDEEMIDESQVDYISVSKLDDGATKVTMFGGDCKTMKIMRIEDVQLLADIIKDMRPEWVLFDCRVGFIVVLGVEWFKQVKKYHLTNVNTLNDKLNIPLLSHVTHLQIDNNIKLKINEMLPFLKSLEELNVTGDTIGTAKQVVDHYVNGDADMYDITREGELTHFNIYR